MARIAPDVSAKLKFIISASFPLLVLHFATWPMFMTLAIRLTEIGVGLLLGYHICERKSDVENPGDEDSLLQTTDPNQMPLGTNKEAEDAHSSKAPDPTSIFLEVLDSGKDVMTKNNKQKQPQSFHH
uniref:Uncharacterized protein n=1 Tax=Magallana gigas TaxID=29159 RepID=K1RE75_MAGGI